VPESDSNAPDPPEPVQPELEADVDADEQTAQEDASPDLDSALARFGIEMPPELSEQLDRYCTLLWDWNTKLNLTRHTTYDKFVSLDLIDTLELAAQLAPGEEVMDVGSGGGVPGIVLAILRPDLQLSLVESVGKKANVLTEIAQELELTTPIFNARAEDLMEDFRVDTVVARAVGPIWKMLFWFQEHWISIGRILAIKGPNWPAERKEARHRGLMNEMQLRKIASYPRPGADGESVILQIWPKGREL